VIPAGFAVPKSTAMTTGGELSVTVSLSSGLDVVFVPSVHSFVMPSIAVEPAPVFMVSWPVILVMEMVVEAPAGSVKEAAPRFAF